MRTILIALLVGCLLGAGITVMIPSAPPEADLASEELDRLRARIAELEKDAPEAGPTLLLVDAPAEQARSMSPPVADAGTQSRVASLAEKIRADARQRIATAEETARTQITVADLDERRRLDNERHQREDLARGGTMTYLRALRSEFTPPFELLGSSAKFAELFKRRVQGGRVDGPGIDARTTLEDGDTILYGPGRHELDVRLVFNRQRALPKDLLVEGYGMDKTVLVLSNDISVRSEINSLTFRDLTLHCNDNYMDRSRSKPFTIRMERCRVIGFDMGAGGSCMLGGRVGAFYASDCRFEAGFGGSPGSGSLFNVRGMLITRMERCAIVGPFRSVYRRGSSAAYLYEDCQFLRIAPGLESKLEHAPSVRIVDCTFESLTTDEARAHHKQRPLTDLNPAWGKSKRAR